MKISGISGAVPQPGQAGLQQADSVSKNIQKQIADKQKELQNLSSNQELDMEEKRKKRQEIMQEISDLNNQLRQRQIEQRREAANAKKSQEKGSSMDDLIGGNRRNPKGGTKGNGLSQASMKAMISADSAINQAQVQGSVATSMENRAGVLEAEIKQDGGRTDVTAKKEELAEMEQRAEDASASQLNTLGEANKEIREAQEAEETEAKTGSKKKTDSKKKAEDTNKTAKGQKTEKGQETEGVQAEESALPTAEAAGGEKGAEDAPAVQSHPSIDVYL